MPKTLVMLGLGLVVLWIVLTVTRAVVSGALWLLLIAGIALLVVSAVKHFGGGRRSRSPVG